MVTPLKTLMGFSVHLNVQLKFYNLPNLKHNDFWLKSIVIIPISLISYSYLQTNNQLKLSIIKQDISYIFQCI